MYIKIIHTDGTDWWHRESSQQDALPGPRIGNVLLLLRSDVAPAAQPGYAMY